MKIGKLFLLLVILFNLVTLSGCGTGADSETNGNITLGLASTPGTPYKIDATATFSKAVPNFPINFNWRIISINDPTGSQNGNYGSSGAISTNDLGVATFTLNMFPTDVEMSVQVEAKSGNVSSGTKAVIVPAN